LPPTFNLEKENIMGGRANICNIYSGGDEIYFYTHNRGTDLPVILQEALQKRWRWADEAYLARIIFCHLVKGMEGSEYSFGIAPYEIDPNHDTIEVLHAEQVVVLMGSHYSFEEYCDLDLSTIRY